MKHYVLGFYFDPNSRVVLILKTRPEWCAGKLNGLGGSIEPGETPLQAMIREFREESGINTDSSAWTEIIPLVHERWEMTVFRGLGPTDQMIESCDEGTLNLYPGIPDGMDGTARWLLSMIRDMDKAGYKCK